MVSTGIAIGIPTGTYGRVAPRSGLAAKHGIDVGAGVIDPDYTGEVNDNDIPDGRGFMQYNNGVVEDGFFVNGVFQPPMPGMVQPQHQQQVQEGNQVPSSSMSVWSLKSTPTMVMQGQNPGNVIMGQHQGNASVMGAPSSVHMGNPSNNPYGNIHDRYS